MCCSNKINVIAFLLIINCFISIEALGQVTSVNSNIIYDTVVVYDTIPVYDTIWEYETVYDTLWVINPGQKDTALNLLRKIDPMEIRQVYYSPFSSSCRMLTFPPIAIAKLPKPKPTLADRIYSEFQQIKKGPSRIKSFNGQMGKFTLNPNKGKFDPHAFWNGTFSIDAYMGYNYQIAKYKFESRSLLIKSIGDSIKTMPGRDYGLRLNYNIYQLTIQTGIGISNLKEKINYSTQYLRIDSIPLDPYVVDSITGDTSLYFIDSTIVTNYHSTINKHVLIEVPLIFSYAVMFGRLQLDLKLGEINQFHVRSKGEMFGDSAIVADINKNILFTKYNIALYGGAGLQFYITDHLCLGADAFYKYPFKPFCTGLGTTFYKRSYGFNFAIRYLF
jgi:hypothetical protein